MFSGHSGFRVGTEGPGATSSETFWEKKKASSWTHSGLQPFLSLEKCYLWRFLHDAARTSSSLIPNSHLQDVKSCICKEEKFFTLSYISPWSLQFLRDLSISIMYFRRKVSLEERHPSSSFWKPTKFYVSLTKSQKTCCWENILSKIQILLVSLRKNFMWKQSHVVISVKTATAVMQ